MEPSKGELMATTVELLETLVKQEQKNGIYRYFCGDICCKVKKDCQWFFRCACGGPISLNM